MRRDTFLTVRLTAAERAAWKAKAAAAGRTRSWTAPAAEIARERTRQVARIGNNLNQIARWANTYKEAAQAAQVIAHLLAIEREIGELAGRDSGDGAR